MLNCHRVLSRLSKVTRQVNAGYIDQQSEKFIGRIGTRHASDKKTKNNNIKPVSGTTLKAEDCIPKKNEKISSIEEASSTTSCDIPTSKNNFSCPPECEINCGTIPPNGPKDNTIFSNYWKHILAAIALTGVSIYALTRNNKNNDQLIKKIDKNNIIKNDESYNNKNNEKIRYPLTSLSIPPEVPYLLIGGGTAAFSAFRSIKSHDPKAKVLVITDESANPYMRPPLSKELWFKNNDKQSINELNFKQWNGTQRSVYYEPPEFYTKVENLISSDKGGVAVATGWKIERIDPLKKIAILDDGYEIKYDKCLIATGASPKKFKNI